MQSLFAFKISKVGTKGLAQSKNLNKEIYQEMHPISPVISTLISAVPYKLSFH